MHSPRNKFPFPLILPCYFTGHETRLLYLFHYSIMLSSSPCHSNIITAADHWRGGQVRMSTGIDTIRLHTNMPWSRTWSVIILCSFLKCVVVGRMGCLFIPLLCRCNVDRLYNHTGACLFVRTHTRCTLSSHYDTCVPHTLKLLHYTLDNLNEHLCYRMDY